MKKVLGFLFAAFLTLGAAGQTGYLRGTIIDGATGEGMFGATVTKIGTTQGAITDFNGDFSIKLDVGTHDISISFVSYTTQTIQGVQIKDGDVTTLEVTLEENVAQLEGVVVTAEQIRDNEVALLSVQKKSANTIDGMSSAAFKKIGDSDLGGVMKRVTGVSVQGGKYVYVRGLGDRYTKTTMNEMSIPGLDPDRNSVQMDIFPTSTIENVMVYKTFTPDLAADFTGGSVNIETKSFPEEKYTNISFGLGYNPAMHLKDNYLSYEGGKYDWLGFDDGTRKLPFDNRMQIKNPVGGPEAAKVSEESLRAFSPVLAAEEQSNFMNSNFSVAHGNQLDKGGITFGYNAILNYQNNIEFYDNVRNGQYRRENEDTDQYDFAAERTRKGSEGRRDVLWSALLAGAAKMDNSSYSLSVMRSQNGNSRATRRIAANQDDNPSILQEDILRYIQRSVTSAVAVGKHRINEMDLEWRGATSWSRQYEPDFRDTRIQILEDGEYNLSGAVGAGINKYYRDLNEANNSAKVDLSIPYWEKNKLKFGSSVTLKNRDYELLEYFIDTDIPLTGDPNQVLLSENILSETNPDGAFVTHTPIPSNLYESSMNVYGFYGMTEMKVNDFFKAIYGLRAEMVKMKYTGENQRGVELQDSLVLDELDLLPSVNLVFSLNENMNIRTSYNRTLARPSFSEKSNVQIFDPISRYTRIGNLELEETYINNYDLRWEYFYSADEMVSVSGFYKTFDGHIEWVKFELSTTSLKPRNSGSSRAYGVEVEFRKNLVENVSFGTNASIIKSEVDRKSVLVKDKNTDGTIDPGSTEYEVFQNYLKDGEPLERYRTMSGQSPYIVNGFINVKNRDNTMNANLSYNVQGETLSVVGLGLGPNQYVKPFHSLNMRVSKSFGPEAQTKVSFGVDNILDSERKEVFKAFKAKEEIFEAYKPGRTFSVKYAYSF